MSTKILAIDDHPDTIQLIEMALQRHGYEVLGAYSGPEGLEIAEKEHPDLILLDMMMPGMDGNAVCRAIRQNPDLAKTPVIMFTAKSQAMDKKGSFDAGADDYVTKPTRPSELLERIEALLARQPARRQDDPPPAENEPETEPEDRRFITVVGARSGAGSTTVALNLAATIAAEGTETILVDLDTRQGHAGLYTGHSPSAGIQEWLAQPIDELKETLTNYLVNVDENLQLLSAQSNHSDEDAAWQRSTVEAATTALSATGRTVIVDLGSYWGETVNPFLQQSDLVLICLRPQRPAIIGARKLFERLQQVVDRDKIQLLMIDFGEGARIAREAVETYLDKPLCDVIELNLGQLTAAVGRQKPLVHGNENGPAVQQFRRLARQLIPVT